MRKAGQILTAVLVDYDNIYLALRRKNEDAAKRFAKDAASWLREIEQGRIITPTNSLLEDDTPRRIVLNRCYGNPVPRRNTHDNSTDMYSFPFVRHHFLRAGFEVVDCPPLTAQLKNSSDIRMVMDVRDFLLHDTYFDEFIIMSGDADFTPVLHRLRAHARRTVIFANDHTAAPYKAISDGEVREAALIEALVGERKPSIVTEPTAAVVEKAAPPAQLESPARAILAEVIAAVHAASAPIPLDLLAERVVRVLGQDQTTGTEWAGAGSFRDLLTSVLPDGIRIGEQPPYYVIDTRRQLIAEPVPVAEAKPLSIEPAASPAIAAPAKTVAAPISIEPASAPAPLPAAAQAPQFAPAPAALPSFQPSADFFRQPPLAGLPTTQQTFEPRLSQPQAPAVPQPQAQQVAAPQLQMPPATYPPQPQPQIAMPPPAPAMAPPAPQPPAPQRQVAQLGLPPQAPPQPAPTATANALQQSIARIHEACQAPPLSPPEYRVLFDVMAREISERGLAGSQTLTSIAQRAQQYGVDVRRDDVRFVLEVVSETDPWFEQGASPTLFAGRFRNFVVARCRSQGLTLSVDELDLIEAWFVAGAPPQPATQQQPAANQAFARTPPPLDPRSAEAARGYAQGFGPAQAAGVPSLGQPGGSEDEFPRIVRTRLRG